MCPVARTEVVQVVSDPARRSRCYVRGLLDCASASRPSFALLRARFARLRERSDETASLFVSARRRVLARWASIDGTATGLADMMTAAAVTQRPRWSRERVGALTIDGVAPLLAKLELPAAAMLLRGPARALQDAYSAIQRQHAPI